MRRLRLAGVTLATPIARACLPGLAIAALLAAACQEGAVGDGGVVGTDPDGGVEPPARSPAGAVCEADADCASELCLERLCARRCGACPPGETCESVTVPDGGGSFDLCRRRAGLPDLELGPVPTGDDGASGELSFEVPAGVASFTVLVADDDGLRVSVRSLVAPDGTVLADLHDDRPDLDPVKPYPGASAMLVPNTDDPRAAPQAGAYRLRLGSYDPADFEALVPVPGGIERVSISFVHEGDQGGSLDLTLHLAPATGLTANTAPTDPFVKDALAVVREQLAMPAGIRLSEMAYADLAAEHDVVEDGAEARAMCRTLSAPGANGASVDVFLVGELSFTSGFAGGIPGPGVAGTTASGVVIEALGSGADTGILLAHELGHFLGLFHTTDLSGEPDPLGDTPECPSGTPVEACPDGRNLMFPVFPLESGLELSAGQLAVLRRSALLYEVGRPEACPGAPRTVDVTGTGFATGDTSRLPSAFEGSCGGTDAPERVHLFRLLEPASALEVRATGVDFAPVVHVRRGACSRAEEEVACAAADAGAEAYLRVEQPAPGAFFVFVDGRDGAGGTYTLDVTAVP